MDNWLFVDTWGQLTLLDQGERKHQEVIDFYHQTSDETFTLLFKRLNAYQARLSLEILVKAYRLKKINLIFIDQARFTKTESLRLKYMDKPYISFTDLTSMVVMEELNIQKVLTEDSHFLQVGMGFEKVP